MFGRKTEVDPERTALLSGASRKPTPAMSHERKAFLQGVDGIEAGNSRLKQSKTQLYQSEAIGHNILGDLQNQRETIGRGRQ
eukprot:7567465-Pyramimonas_sp.AAC.1